MRLSTFISDNQQTILAHWVAFARQQMPAARNMDDAALLDHGKAILEKIVSDMQQPQTEGERKAKSEGHGTRASGSDAVPSRSHARQRERQGFEIEQMVAEYRALRATVLRLWTAAPVDAQSRDLEEITRFNEAVDQAMAESLKVFVAEVERTRDLFLGSLSHDLRGPLSTISSCASLHLRSQPADTRHVLVILRSVAQMKLLLDDLVEYTRHRLGARLAIDPAPLHLGEFARNTLDEIDAIDTGRTLELTVHGNLDGEWDARRLHQALSNLVFNAVKYGAAGAPIRIDVDGSRSDEVVVAVRNAGVPIPADLLPRLFEPLVRGEGLARQTEADSQVAGANLGLGLYVVREIANAHGGIVTVTSDAASTCFELRLPRIFTR